jgi:hypothetical protein
MSDSKQPMDNDLSDAAYRSPGEQWQRREILATVLLVLLTPATVLLVFGLGQELRDLEANGRFDLWLVVKSAVGGSGVALLFGFGPSLVGSFFIVFIGGILARTRIDSIWISTVLGAFVGLTVPDAPSVIEGLHKGLSLQQAIADRTWRGFWPYFGIAATAMSLLNWWIAIRPRRRWRLNIDHRP